MKKFELSNDGVIGGVCAGFANYTGIDVTIIRIVYLLATLMLAGFPGVLIYILFWWLAPSE